MGKRVFILGLILVAGLPVVGLGVQRLGRARGLQRMQGAFGGAAVTPAQIWRLTSLTLEQRKQLNEVQRSAFAALRDAREGGRVDRRELAGALRDVESRVERVVTPDQLAAARALPRVPLTPEELVYYPVTSLKDLDPARRAKIDAVFKPAIEEARDEAVDGPGLGRGRRAGGDAADQQQREALQGEQRERRLALFEVLEALLTTDQMVAVKQFLPEQLRNAGLRERIVYRLPSLTLEQEAQARAVFAALEDETAADQARLKAITNELRGKDAAKDERQKLVDERRQINERVSARERQAYADLSKVLTPEQMKELAAQRPGPPRPLVFTPEAIRSLANLTPDQQRRIRDAMQSFQRETAGERQKMRDLREQAKGADIQSLEMAGVRDQLRHVAEVLDVERDRVTRAVADALTGEQLAQLVAAAGADRKGRKDEKVK